MYLFQALGELLFHSAALNAHKGRKLLHALACCRQQMCLLIRNHLHTVLNFSMRTVVVHQCLSHILWNPAFLRQNAQRRHSATHAKISVAPTRNQLASLGEKLNLAYTATSELHVMAHQVDPAAKPLVLSDTQAHIMSILNRRKVEVLAPDKRAQRLQKRLPCRLIACTAAGLDVGRALPCTPEALVISLCRFDSHTHRCHSRIRA